MQSSTHEWLPPLPSQEEVDRALQKFAPILKTVLVESDQVFTERELQFLIRMSVADIAPAIIEVEPGESDLALGITTDISMDRRVRSRSNHTRSKIVHFEQQVQPSIVAKAVNEMTGKRISVLRESLVIALIHAFIDDTDQRIEFFRSAEHICESSEVFADPDERERRLQQDLPLLFDRACHGRL